MTITQPSETKEIDSTKGTCEYLKNAHASDCSQQTEHYSPTWLRRMVCHGAVALLPWELRAVTVNVYSPSCSSSVTRYGDVTFCNNHQRSPHLSCHKHPGLRITNISSTPPLFVHLTTTTQMSFVCVLTSF